MKDEVKDDVKEDVLEVLLFIFEHLFNDETEATEQEEDLLDTLEQCGFSKNESNKALLWLDDLVELREQNYSAIAKNATSIRIYTPYEQEVLNADCRGFILFLEQMGVLDCQSREMVIDRAIALEGKEVDLDRIKWVVMMVLYNMPNKESEFVWLENLDQELEIH